MGTEGSLSTKYLGNPTDVYVDPNTNEAFISDGYINRRIIVFDARTGEFKRLWCPSTPVITSLCGPLVDP